MPHPFAAFFRGRRVLVTGHTEFPCGWLVAWLKALSAQVYAFGPPPATRPNFFDATLLDRGISSVFADIRNRNTLAEMFAQCQPEIVIHNANHVPAERAFRDPVEAFSSSLMGTVNVLEEARLTRSVRAVVIVTSALCYENRGAALSCREEDAIGGSDPHCASLAAVELAAAAYSRSFFQNTSTGVATARMTSVAGGGDWRENEVVPDMVREITGEQRVIVHNGAAIHPLLHVLDAAGACLLLAQRLYESGNVFSGAWNFGPQDGDSRTIREISEKFVSLWEGAELDPELQEEEELPRAIQLNTRKAQMHLGWTPRLGFDDALAWTAEWYRTFYSDPTSAGRNTEAQINQFMSGRGCDEADPTRS